MVNRIGQSSAGWTQGVLYCLLNIAKDRPERRSFLYGRSEVIRTPGILLPNLSGILFPLVYSGFRRFLTCFTYSLTLLSPLFPGVPAPSVVIYVVKNASRPVSGELLPGPDGKRFSFLCGLYCNSEQTVMQVVSAKAAAQMLSRYRQRIGRKDRQRYFSYSLSINPLIQA